MSSPWDQAKPDLSKLPVHLRDSLTAPIPVRPHEAKARLSIITKRTGLNHPNARVWVTAMPSDAGTKLILEFADHRGLPQVMVEVRPEDVSVFKEALLHAFNALNGVHEVSADDNRIASR